MKVSIVDNCYVPIVYCFAGSSSLLLFVIGPLVCVNNKLPHLLQRVELVSDRRYRWVGVKLVERRSEREVAFRCVVDHQYAIVGLSHYLKKK